MIELGRLFPAQLDNDYRGHPAALYVFYALTALTLWRSQHHIFAADGGAQSIATVSLDKFTQGGANTVITIFAIWGISQIIIGFIYLIASIRYRAMIPLLYVLFIVEYALRTSTAWFKPGLETAGTAPGAVANYVFLVLGPAMLVLSLWKRTAKN